EVADEVERRLRTDAHEEPEVYLLLHDLARFRDLRRRDDEPFATRSEPSIIDGLELILCEGPPLGVYALTWCDGLNNLSRALGRQALREFGQRVLFQMSPADSSLLMDQPTAGRLGPHRAIFYDEGQNLLEKFRPYGFPATDWIDWAL